MDFKSLKKEEISIYNLFKESLDTVPDLPVLNHNNWKEKLVNKNSKKN